MGQEYMTVRATEVTREYNNASGGSSGDTVTYRIGWTAEGGMTGNGWFWGETPITDWWKDNHEILGYGDSETDFKTYASSVDNLNDAFARWNSASKFYFLSHHSKFGFDPETGEFDSPCVSMV